MKEHSSGAGANIRASVVIPALNEERHIGDCLRSISRAKPPGGAFEVIVVDNGSTDRTIDIIESFRTALELTLLKLPGVPVSAARNFGAAAARGEALLFLDSDCVVPEHWLQVACDQLAQPGAGIVGAFYGLPANSSWVAKTWAHHLSRSPDGEVSYLGAHNLALRRSVFNEVGGFDESLETNEDYDLCQKIREKGLKVLACNAASVIHLGTPQTLREFFHRERWHGRHVSRVFIRDLPRLHNARAVSFAVFTLMTAAGVAVGTGAALLGGSPALVVGAVSALIVAATFLGVRYTRPPKRWAQIPLLSALFLTWGVARAMALLDMGLPKSMLRRKWQGNNG